MGSATLAAPKRAWRRPTVTVTVLSPRTNWIVPATASMRTLSARPVKYGSSGATTVPATITAACEDGSTWPLMTTVTGGAGIRAGHR